MIPHGTETNHPHPSPVQMQILRSEIHGVGGGGGYRFKTTQFKNDIYSALDNKYNMTLEFRAEIFPRDMFVNQPDIKYYLKL